MKKKKHIQDAVPAKKGLWNNPISKHYRNVATLLLNSKWIPNMPDVTGPPKISMVKMELLCMASFVT